jgi:hypothetical protein
MGPTFTGQMNNLIHLIGQLVKNVQLTSEDGTHRYFRNVVGKFASHIVQRPRNQETVLISRLQLKIKNKYLILSYTSRFNGKKIFISSAKRTVSKRVLTLHISPINILSADALTQGLEKHRKES